MRKWIVAALMLLTHHAHAQGVKMSTFPVAPAVDTGHMKLVIVYDAGGSYLNKQLSLGMFARYLSNSFTSSIAGGYGLNYTGMVFKVDSAVVFPHVLGTLSAGYGLSYAARNFKADTGILFTKLSTTLAAGYGLSFGSRTYAADTGALFSKLATTLSAGYGITYGSRTFKADTGTTFAKLASTLAAGYGISYGSRTFKVDTAALFPAIRSGSDNYYKDSTWSNATTSFTPTTAVSNKLYTVSYNITAQAGSLLINNSTSAWANGQVLLFYIKSSSSTARTLTYGTDYIDGNATAKPTTTVGTQLLVVEFQWNANLGKMICLGTDSY